MKRTRPQIGDTIIGGPGPMMVKTESGVLITQTPSRTTPLGEIEARLARVKTMFENLSVQVRDMKKG
jgi:hypothetical protein